MKRIVFSLFLALISASPAAAFGSHAGMGGGHLGGHAGGPIMRVHPGGSMGGAEANATQAMHHPIRHDHRRRFWFSADNEGMSSNGLVPASDCRRLRQHMHWRKVCTQP
ncbi:hypothetical protein [Labrys monachus]|uniref:Uncharacterized protein n=1 Tax=Labrys monachus TaxID=217067 RepID=A0ABU0FJ26_9HYPH|nr:hypothetical protein [Labrys monachus]MDQ0394617.1 hypothetical protein [Labrys monachus]